jgi:hypothetical protein
MQISGGSSGCNALQHDANVQKLSFFSLLTPDSWGYEVVYNFSPSTLAHWGDDGIH